MELKDNFTNRYFKPDLVKSQIDMIKEPTATDAIAEGFQRYGNLPANNAYAQLDNMTMASVGDGMKAVANNRRQEQIDPILKMTGEINARAAYLEAQMQEQEQTKIQTQQFVKNQAFSFMELSKATAAGDTTAANNIARGILQSYKSSSGDPIIGDFDHYHDGNIYYTNAETGEKAALSIPLLLNQSGIAPELFGADYGMMMSSYSPGFKGQYENELALQRQKLEKGRADIDNTKAHTSHLGMQDKKIENEMNAPKPKYSDKVLGNIITENSKWINNNREEHRKLNKVATAYDNIAKIIEEEVNDKTLTIGGKGLGGRAGSSFISMARRFLDPSITDSSKNQAKLEMLKLPLMEDLKRIYGAQVSDVDLKSFLSTLPSLDKNPEASIKEAQERSEEIKQRLKEDNLTQEVLEDEFGYSEPYNSLVVQRRVQEKLKAKQQGKADNANQGNDNQPKTFNFTPDK